MREMSEEECVEAKDYVKVKSIKGSKEIAGKAMASPSRPIFVPQHACFVIGSTSYAATFKVCRISLRVSCGEVTKTEKL